MVRDEAGKSALAVRRAPQAEPHCREPSDSGGGSVNGIPDLTRRQWTKRIALVLAGLLAFAHLAQFVRSAFYKGQSPMGEAFETIAHETLSRQYNGLPQMRVMAGSTHPTLCAWWNFEATWGTCASVGLDVRDYRPEHLPIVEREVNRLAGRLRQPCALLKTLGLSDEKKLAQAMTCDGAKPGRHFKLLIRVNAVTVVRDPNPHNKPHRWQTTDRNHLNTYRFRGEI